MATETIDNILTRRFSDQMHVLAQQHKSRFRGMVMEKNGIPDDYMYDGIGTIEAREVVGRIQQTVFDDINHFRRKLTKQHFVTTLPVDWTDLQAVVEDPSGRYAQECVRAMERVYDRVVYGALFADVNTGKTGSTAVTFVNDGGLTVDGTTAITLADLLEVQRNFMDNEVGVDIPVDKTVGISGDEYMDLMQITALTSGDFTRQFALEKGEIIKAAGLDLMRFGASVTKPVLTVSGGVRQCFALAKGGVFVGIGKEWEVQIDNRPDYVGVKQIQVKFSLGALRTEGKLVQKVNTTDK